MLRLKNVGKKYGDIHALKHITLTIPKGACYGLVGPNGAGKSTLIKIVASVIHDYQGDLHLPYEIEKKKFKSKVGYVPQEICLEPIVSAYSNLVFFGKLYGLKGAELRERTNEVLEEVGLKERKYDKVQTFSGGMKRRLNIGCALMHRPELIIMDEPTVGIDPQSRVFIFQMIKEMKQQGCTIIYASHYMEEVEKICDEVAFLDYGEIIEQGVVEDLLKAYASPTIFVKGARLRGDDLSEFDYVENEDGGILIKTESPLATMQDIITFCRRENYGIERLEFVQPRLENVFMDLTGNALRD